MRSKVATFFNGAMDLTKKLSNDDIGSILVCIDAKSMLKSMYLSDCKNITGCGLKSLFGSSDLEGFHINGCNSLVAKAFVPFIKMIVFADGISLRNKISQYLERILPEK